MREVYAPPTGVQHVQERSEKREKYDSPGSGREPLSSQGFGKHQKARRRLEETEEKRLLTFHPRRGVNLANPPATVRDTLFCEIRTYARAVRAYWWQNSHPRIGPKSSLPCAVGAGLEEKVLVKKRVLLLPLRQLCRRGFA